MNYEWEKTENNDIPQPEQYAESAEDAARRKAQEEMNAAAGAQPEQSAPQSQQSAPQPAPQPAEKKKMSPLKKTLLILLCVAVGGAAAGGAFYGLSWVIGKTKTAVSSGVDRSIELPSQSGREERSEESDKTNKERGEKIGQTGTGNYRVTSMDVSELVEENMPSLVQITAIEMVSTNDYYSNPFYYFFGGGEPGGQGGSQEAQKSLGSGVIVGKSDDELFIVTNAHVTDGADNLSVTFDDGEICDAFLKGSDSDIDIALICVKISDMKDSTLEAIKIARLGDSDALKIGQQVIAIGNALGYGQSVTTGIVSALNREATTSTTGLIQTDAAINPGNSGGALFNANGELIGINNSKSVSYEVEGIGYAIPINEVIPLIEEYQQNKTRVKVDENDASYLGITGADIDSTTAQYYRMPEGIYISSLVADGPCERAGVPERCVITALDSNSVKTMSGLRELLTYYAAGETVKLTVQELEGGSYVEHVYEVTLGRAADYNKANEQGQQPGNNGQNGGGNTWGNLP